MCNERKHVYKVGDKGKLSDGTDYEVVAVVPHLPVPVIITMSRNGSDFAVGLRDLNGVGAYGHSTMIPPKRIAYVNIVGEGDNVGSHAYSTEDRARTAADKYKCTFKYLKIAHPIELD